MTDPKVDLKKNPELSGDALEADEGTGFKHTPFEAWFESHHCQSSESEVYTHSIFLTIEFLTNGGTGTRRSRKRALRRTRKGRRSLSEGSNKGNIRRIYIKRKNIT